MFNNRALSTYFYYFIIDYLDINPSVNRQPLEDVLADWNDVLDDGGVVGPVGVPVEARLSAFDIRTIPPNLFLRESKDDSRAVVDWLSSSSGQEVVEVIPCDPLPIRCRRCCCFPRPRSHTSPSFLRRSLHRVSAKKKWQIALDRNCKWIFFQVDNDFFYIFIYLLLNYYSPDKKLYFAIIYVYYTHIIVYYNILILYI